MRYILVVENDRLCLFGTNECILITLKLVVDLRRKSIETAFALLCFKTHAHSLILTTNG